MTPLRMGYVGAGFLAQKVHLPNLAALPQFDLVALAEPRAGVARAVAARHGIERVYGSHLELAADRDLEAVAVSGHYYGQGEIAADLLRAGKHVFVEKPMAISVAQARRMLEAERTGGGRLMVGYMKRYDAGYAAVRELLDDAALRESLGRLLYVRAHEFGGDWLGGLETPVEESDEPFPPAPATEFPGWLPDALQQPYLLYVQEYAHHVNLVRWFLGADAVEVRAVDLDERDHYTGAAILAMAGHRVVLESGELTAHVWDEHVQLYFEHGWIRASSEPLLLRNAPAEVELYRVDGERATRQLIAPMERTWAYREELVHFADCLCTERPFRTPGADALHDVEALERIYRAHVDASGACS